MCNLAASGVSVKAACQGRVHCKCKLWAEVGGKGCIVNLRNHRRGMLKSQMQQHAEQPQFCVGQHLSPSPNKNTSTQGGTTRLVRSRPALVAAPLVRCSSYMRADQREGSAERGVTSSRCQSIVQAAGAKEELGSGFCDLSLLRHADGDSTKRDGTLRGFRWAGCSVDECVAVTCADAMASGRLHDFTPVVLL